MTSYKDLATRSWNMLCVAASRGTAIDADLDAELEVICQHVS